MSTSLTLNVIRGGEVVTSQVVEGELVKIGRMASAHLRIDDPKVSRIHAMLEVGADGRVSLIDMGSAQGTLVDGKPISKVALSSGDRFVLGDTTVEVIFGAAPSAAEPAPAEPASAGSAEAAPEDEPEAVESAVTEPAAVEPEASEPAPKKPVSAKPVASKPAATKTEASKPTAAKSAASKPTAAKSAATKPAKAKTRAVKPATNAQPASHGALPLPAPWPKGGAGRTMALQVGIFWGDQPLDAGAFFDESEVTLGGAKATFAVHPGELPRDPYPLVRKEGEGWILCIPQGASGGVIREGSLRSFEELQKEGALQTGEGGLEYLLDVFETAYLQFGNIRATFCFRPRRKPILVEWTQTLDYNYLNVLAVSFFLVSASVVSFLTTEPSRPMDADDLFANQARFTRLLLQPPERAAQNPFLQRLKKLKEPEGTKAVRAPGEEGKMGKENAPQVARRAAPQGNPNDKEMVANQGILSILGKGSAGLSTVLGSSGLGGELKGAIGGLTGNAVGDAQGFGGLGLRGRGPGGGAVGETVSVGAIGTRGRGGGSAGFGEGVGGLGAKGSADVKIDTSAVSITGTIDRELIRRVIQANHGRFKYCYENELVRNPRLSGRIAVRFQINAQGKVSFANVDSSTMGNPSVENCVVSRIRGLTFPMPQGGGAALVTYPFVFTPPGE